MAKAVLYRISDATVLRYNVDYPSIEIKPLEGLDTDLRWYIILEGDKPPFDAETEKLVEIRQTTETPHPDYPEILAYTVDYEVQPLDSQELAEVAERISTEIENKHIEDGQNFIKSIRIEARIRRYDGRITRAQYDAIMGGVRNVLSPLLIGDWLEAQVQINAVTPPQNATLLQVYNFIKNFVDQYIIDNEI